MMPDQVGRAWAGVETEWQSFSVEGTVEVALSNLPLDHKSLSSVPSRWLRRLFLSPPGLLGWLPLEAAPSICRQPWPLEIGSLQSVQSASL